MIVALFLAVAAQASNEPLARDFLDALATKDRTRIKTFVAEHFVAKISPEEFSGRLMPIAEQGTPFKLLRIHDDTPDLLRCLVRNRNGVEWALTLNLNGKKPPLITGVFLTSPESLDQPPPKDYSGWKSLSSLAEDIRNSTQVPAIAVAYRVGDDPIVASVSGVKNLGKPDPVSSEEVWHLGSISKSITATLVGRLIEMGKLDWNSTLGSLLDGFELSAAQKQISIHQIMLHRGGLPQDMGFSREQVEKIVGQEKDSVKVRERYVREILSRPLISTPGSEFAYSNAGYVILGHIAERLMERPFEELCKELVFKPMGLTSAVAGTSGLPSARPSGHWMQDGKLVPVVIDEPLQQMMVPAGNMSMSIKDLVRYGGAHLAGLQGKDGVLKAATIKKLHESVEEEPGGSGYACGWSVGPLPGTQVRHGHNGSNRTFIAELAFFPESGLVVASVVNRGGEAEPSPPLQAVLAVARKFAPKRN